MITFDQASFSLLLRYVTFLSPIVLSCRLIFRELLFKTVYCSKIINILYSKKAISFIGVIVSVTVLFLLIKESFRISDQRRNDIRTNEPIRGFARVVISSDSEATNGNQLKPPNGKVLKYDPKFKTIYLQDVCAQRDWYFMFNMTDEEQKKAAKDAGSAGFFIAKVEENTWEKSQHIYGPTLSILGNFGGVNNLQHMWYGRQFPALVLGMEQHLNGDTFKTFENVLIDGSTYFHGPVKWHRGLNRIIVDIISDHNIKLGGNALKVYETSNTNVVCCDLLMSQGNGNFLKTMSRIDLIAVSDYINMIRVYSFKKAGIPTPTKNRCPRKVLVFAKWDSGHKRWLDASEFATLFRSAHPELEVEYWEKMKDMEFEEQIQYFANLDIFICSDGSHQMSAIYMPEQSVVVETTDGTGWYNPWNEVNGFNEIARMRFLAIESRLATNAEYDHYMKDFDPQDLINRKHMGGAHVVNQKEMLEKVDNYLHKAYINCINVPKGHY